MRKLLLFVLLLSIYFPVDFVFRNFNINPQDVVFGMVFLLFVVRILASGRFTLKLFDKRILIPLLALVVYSSLQLPFVQSQFRVAVELLQILEIVFLVFILSGNNFLELSDSDITEILTVFFYFSLFGAINASVYAAITGNRFVGVQSVWFAFGSLLYGFFYSFYHCVFSRRVIYYIFLCIFTVAVVLSNTRGIWLSVPLSIGFVFLTSKTPRKRILMYSFGFLMLFAAYISGFGLPSRFVNRFSSIFTGTQDRDERLYRYATSILIFLDHPLGTGLGNARYYTMDYAAWDYPAFEKAVRKVKGEQGEEVIGPRLGAHSDWITLLAETGPIGVLLYGWFWLILMGGVVFKKIRTTNALVTATFLTSIFISTFVGEPFLSGPGLTMIFMYYFYIRSSRAPDSGR